MTISPRAKQWLLALAGPVVLAFLWSRSIGWLGSPVAFTTLAQGQFGGRPFNLHLLSLPGLYVVSEREHVEELGELFGLDTDYKRGTSPLIGPLRQVKFESYLAILVAAGGKAVTIERIVRVGDRVVVHARIPHPRPGEVELQMLTDPFHIVELEKRSFLGPAWTFELWDGRNKLVEVGHYVGPPPRPTPWPTVTLP